MFNQATFMSSFVELAKKYQDLLFPSGKISLYTVDDLRDNPLYIQLFANTQPKNIVVEKNDTVSLLSKVTAEFFIELEGDTTKTNINLLKNLSKRIITEMRKSAVTINK